jgi:hypothetical protein
MSSKLSFRADVKERSGPPAMLSGDHVWEFVRDFPKVTKHEPSKISGFGTLHNWTKRSIFRDLLYWKDNLLRHNLDVMHIEKNFFDNVFHIVINDPDKTKDHQKARMDMKKHCRRGDLKLQPLNNGKWGCQRQNIH